MANPNDGTQLGTGEVISDEYLDQAPGNRQDGRLPGTAYKIPRSKIVVGPYGQDGGDASPDNALPVESASLRRLQEQDAIRDFDMVRMGLMARYGERITLIDQRGRAFSTRGSR